MELNFTKQFTKDYEKLNQDIKKQVDKKLNLLLVNIRHPSLRVKKLEGRENIYEGSINMKYRFLFQLIENNDIYLILRVGKHDILEK